MAGSHSLEMRNISKRFPGVVALDHVSLNVKSGTVHCIVGENGAGKSTLMKILSGLYVPDEGEILIDGEEVVIKSPVDAMQKGISIIQQELAVAPELTVAQAVFLNREPMKFGGLIVDSRKMEEETQAILDRQNLPIRATQKMKELSIAQKQMIEIGKAVSFDAKVIIMDEPTSAISDREVEELFRTIRQLRANDVAVIYISHKMEELAQIADEVTILRDGKYIGSWPMKELTPSMIISRMVGRDISNRYPKDNAVKENVVLEAEGLTAADGKSFRNISFTVHAGEIFGLSGLMGAGRTEVVRSIFGLDPLGSGTLRIEGKDTVIHNPTEAIRNGVAMVTEDRRKYGVVLVRSIRENISLPNLDLFSGPVMIDQRKEKEKCREIFDSLSIKAPSLETATANLSGGNQQKVVLVKWLLRTPKVLILDEPTRGIDVGAKYEIYQLMNQIANQGVAIVFISSELPEILGMCDRVLVMCEGKATGLLTREEMSQESIMRYAVGDQDDISEVDGNE